MEYKLFDSFLDPIFVVDPDGSVLYVNPIAVRWMALKDDFGIIGENISQFVTFSESKALESMASLTELEHSYYHLTHFKLNARNYESFTKLCVLRLPNTISNHHYALILRDREFIKNLLDQDDFNLTSSSNIAPTTGSNSSTALKGLVENVNTDSNVLNEDSILLSLPTERRAKFESVANLVFIDTAKAAFGHVNLISDDWVYIIIKNISNLKVGMKVKVDLAGNLRMRGFSTVGELQAFRPMGDDQEVKITFGSISPLARQALAEYLENYKLPT